MCLAQLSWVKHFREVGRVSRFNLTLTSMLSYVFLWMLQINIRLQVSHCETSKTKENQCHSYTSDNCSTASLATLQVDKLECKCKPMEKSVFPWQNNYFHACTICKHLNLSVVNSIYGCSLPVQARMVKCWPSPSSVIWQGDIGWLLK